ncbi:MAG: ATP-binding protein [Methanobacteriaceae archaeon]|nr:ATP-binding protein [Methanobacteriaceae archaeon]
MDGKFRLEVEADLKNLSVIADFISRHAREMGLNDKGIFQLQLAADEVASNIILHGYPKQTGGPIHLTIYEKTDKIILIIEDRGQPFNPLDADKPDLKASLEDRSPGGLGIHFLKTLADDVHYEYRDGVNRLTVLKNIS